MRLIDADELLTVTEIREDGTEFSFVHCSEIEDAKVVYDVDAVVKQLEEEKNLHEEMIKYEQKNGTITEEFQARRAVEVLERAIKIVKGGGVDGN